MNKTTFSLIICSILLAVNGARAQNYEWEIDKNKTRELEREENLDSILVHMKNSWEIRLAYGALFLSERAKSDEEEPFFFPTSMPLWQLAVSWHVMEKLSAGISVGFQQKRNPPENPNISSILSGDDIQLEGSGGGFFPIEVNAKYYLTEGRFRPFVGGSSGIVLGRSLYTIAEGNINDGITRTDVTSSYQVWLGQVNTGFDYRLGTNAVVGLNGSYYVSQEFEEPIGGYMNYEGWMLNAGLSLLLYGKK